MRPLDPQSIFSSSSVFNLKQARSVGLVRAWRPSFTFHVVPSLSRTILLRLPPSAVRFAGAFSPGSFQNRVGESWPCVPMVLTNGTHSAALPHGPSLSAASPPVGCAGLNKRRLLRGLRMRTAGENPAQLWVSAQLSARLPAD